MLGPKQKYLKTLTDIISSEQLRKLEKIKPFDHKKATFFTKKLHFAHFPRPGENDTYVESTTAFINGSFAILEKIYVPSHLEFYRLQFHHTDIKAMFVIGRDIYICGFH